MALVYLYGSSHGSEAMDSLTSIRSDVIFRFGRNSYGMTVMFYMEHYGQGRKGSKTCKLRLCIMFGLIDSRASLQNPSSAKSSEVFDPHSLSSAGAGATAVGSAR